MMRSPAPTGHGFPRLFRSGSAVFAAVFALSACDNAPKEQPSPPPPPVPVAEPQPVIVNPPPPRPNSALRAARAERAEQEARAAQRAANTETSRTMHGYFEGVEDMLVARSQLRRDNGADIPVSAAELTRNFIDIALFDEYTRNGADLVAKASPSRLRRWNQPVRIATEFGASVPPATRTRDRAEVHSFAERLTSITGHDISVSPSGGNFTVFFLNEDERRNIGPRLEAVVPGIPAADIEAIENLPPQNYCTVFAYSLGRARSIRKQLRSSARNCRPACAIPASMRNWRKGWVWPTTARTRARRSSTTTRSSHC